MKETHAGRRNTEAAVYAADRCDDGMFLFPG